MGGCALAVAADGGPCVAGKRKHAATRITNAPVFTAAVISWALLPERIPLHCKTANPARDNNGNQFQVATEDGHQVAAVFGDHDPHNRSGPAGGKPIAPTHDKTGVFANGPPREIYIARRFAGSPRRARPATKRQTARKILRRPKRQQTKKDLAEPGRCRRGCARCRRRWRCQ